MWFGPGEVHRNGTSKEDVTTTPNFVGTDAQSPGQPPQQALRLPATPELSTGTKLRRTALMGVAYGLVAAWFLSGIQTCPTAATLGVPCPGCGLTRATLAAAQGDFAEAFALHPLFWLISPVFIVLLLAVALGYIRGRTVLPFLARVSPRTITIAGIAFSVVTFGVWLARFYGAFGGPVPVG